MIASALVIDGGFPSSRQNPLSRGEGAGGPVLVKLLQVKAVHSSAHCVRTFSSPRTVQRRKPMACLIVANTGSMIALRWRSKACFDRIARASRVGAVIAARCGLISILRPFRLRLHNARTGHCA